MTHIAKKTFTAMIIASLMASPAFATTTIGTNISTDGSITGTGSISLQPLTTGTVTIGSTGETGTITVGQSTDTNTISIGSGATATGATQTINIGAGVDVGTGKAAITIGNTNGASSLVLDSGSGGTALTTSGVFSVNATSGITIDGFATTATSTFNGVNAIYLHANGGTSETIQIRADQGSSASSINIVSDAGGITLNASGDVTVTNNEVVGGTLSFKNGTGLLSSSQSLTTDQSGSVYAVSQASAVNVLLPAITAGLHYRFVLTTADAHNFSITTSDGSAIMYGVITDPGDGAGANIITPISAANTVSFVSGVAAVGDYIEVTALYTGVWHVIGVSSANSGIIPSVG